MDIGIYPLSNKNGCGNKNSYPLSLGMKMRMNFFFENEYAIAELTRCRSAYI